MLKNVKAEYRGINRPFSVDKSTDFCDCSTTDDMSVDSLIRAQCYWYKWWPIFYRRTFFGYVTLIFIILLTYYPKYLIYFTSLEIKKKHFLENKFKNHPLKICLNYRF